MRTQQGSARPPAGWSKSGEEDTAGDTKDKWKLGPNLQSSRGDPNPGTTRHPLKRAGRHLPPSRLARCSPGTQGPWSSPRSTPTQPLKQLMAAKESQAFSFTGWTAQALGESSQSGLDRGRPALPGFLTAGQAGKQARRDTGHQLQCQPLRPTAQNKSEIQAPSWGLGFQDTIPCKTSHSGQRPA